MLEKFVDYLIAGRDLERKGKVSRGEDLHQDRQDHTSWYHRGRVLDFGCHCKKSVDVQTRGSYTHRASPRINLRWYATDEVRQEEKPTVKDAIKSSQRERSAEQSYTPLYARAAVATESGKGRFENEIGGAARRLRSSVSQPCPDQNESKTNVKTYHCHQNNDEYDEKGDMDNATENLERGQNPARPNIAEKRECENCPCQ